MSSRIASGVRASLLAATVAVAKRFDGSGNDVLTASGTRVASMLRADHDKWGKVIKASGQKGE